MKKQIVILLILGFLALSCAMTSEPLTPEEEVYVRKINDMPLTFTIAKENSEDAWSRVQGFINKYSSMKIQTASDYTIETYNPTGVNFGYRASRMNIGDEVEFTVSCYCGNMFMGKQANQNAHVLALFALTSDINPRFIYR